MSANNVKQIEQLEAGKWVTLEVTFQQEWETTHESIRQTGLLADGTGIVKFVSWEKSDLPKMVEGLNYRIGKVPVSEYDDYLQISLVSTTNITRIVPDEPDETVEEEKTSNAEKTV